MRHRRFVHKKYELNIDIGGGGADHPSQALTNATSRVTALKTRRTHARALVLVVATALLDARPAIASGVEVGNVNFSEQAGSGSSKLDLHGAGVLRYRGLIRAYAAALYLAPGAAAERALEDVPKRLEIEYFWSLQAEDFASAADELLARIEPADRLAALRGRLRYFHARYEDIEPGDRYALTYFPGVGTELSKNGRSLAVVEGSDFAAAYFAMWLGDDPIDAG
ncbi:MAG: chalcone isomerase family protein, partial [Proteobacteria bacterium]|nr:chalcone isomerase family protein [Pseudomonadota bacterium]